MTSQTRAEPRQVHPAPTLFWILHRDANAITCQLNARDDRSYGICIMPHWHPSSAVIERFESATLALLRHAALAKRLRNKGWIVIDRVVRRGLHATAQSGCGTCSVTQWPI